VCGVARAPRTAAWRRRGSCRRRRRRRTRTRACREAGAATRTRLAEGRSAARHKEAAWRQARRAARVWRARRDAPYVARARGARAGGCAGVGARRASAAEEGASVARCARGGLSARAAPATHLQVSRHFSPLSMVATPMSQPLMTLPARREAGAARATSVSTRGGPTVVCAVTCVGARAAQRVRAMHARARRAAARVACVQRAAARHTAAAKRAALRRRGYMCRPTKAAVGVRACVRACVRAPMPSWNTNGSLRPRLLSNSVPFSSVPT
jgi:hypothetical protein